MPRNALLVRLLAAVGAIAAIALAAATLETTIESGGNGGFGTGDGSSTTQPPPAEQQPIAGGGEIPTFLEYLLAALAIVIAIAFVWYLIAHRREAVQLIAAVLCFSLLIAGGIVLVQDQLPAAEPPSPPEQVNGTGSGEGGSSAGEDSSLSMGPVLLALTAVTAIFVGGLLVSRNLGTSDDTDADRVPDESAPQPDVAAVGTAAGRAADRIDADDESDAVDNEIYRAWREMTAPLEVDRPESSTPREFASAAIDAGLERDHVDELTRLFEDVRYGDIETTPEMETRAVEVLRRIETEYATDEDTPVGSTDGDATATNDRLNSSDAGSSDAGAATDDTRGGDEQ